MEGGWKPSVEFSPACPRCGSSNMKFCYYNNYSLTQPRFFCKGCRRYWTGGGSLRNVPVGGGCRRSRRGRSLRVSPHDCHVSSRNLDSYGSESSSGTSAAPDGSNIDLAVVYANFLNQTPQTSLTLNEKCLKRSGNIHEAVQFGTLHSSAPMEKTTVESIVNLLNENESKIHYRWDKF
ncbi:hypothetical protein RJ639_013342 [Escallonia herrerae]|uniref:Dof zinc finger protein n=1 Tax=Escallonia herrerae TaxID=1293975 RepID=A0AA89AN86_9ASTE|nr:hypothetical protein RJ639_013342 [Escallonia herrerae]